MKQPALLLALGIVTGVALASWLPASLAFVAAAGVCWRWPLLSLGIAAGVVRILASPLAPPESDLVGIAGQERTVRGVVDSFPEYRRTYQQFVVDGTAADPAGDADRDGAAGRRSGKILVRADPFLELAPGDRLAATGSLAEPRVSDDFDYRAYLAKDGVHTIMRYAEVRREGSRRTWKRLFYTAREAWVRQTERAFAEPAAGFSLGILIGERSTLSDAHIEAFRKTGTTHILALSGFNVSVIITAIVGVLGRKPAALVVSLLFIAGFVFLVGPSATVVRAALMGGFLLLGQLFGRPQEAMYAAILTAAGMLLLQPHALRYDVGFDLSFLATLGILWLEPDIRPRLAVVPAAARSIVSATLAAVLLTAPLIALTFGMASPVSPLANLLVVPAVPVLMFGGFVSVAVSFVSPTLAVLPALLTSAATGWLLGALVWLADLPAASLTFPALEGVMAIILAVFAAAASYWLKRRPRHA